MAEFTATTLVHFLTGNDVLKLLEDESLEAESSLDSDESEDYICNLSDSQRWVE